jgi:hypothetical protein
MAQDLLLLAGGQGADNLPAIVYCDGRDATPLPVETRADWHTACERGSERG